MAATDQANNVNTLSDSSGLTDYMKNMPGLSSSFYNTQKGDVNNYLGRYTSAVNNQESLSNIQNRIGNQLGMPALRQNANTLNTTAANIPYTYSGATRGFDVNSNQLSRIIGQKQYEIAPAVTSANNALATGEAQYNTQIGQEQTQQAKQLLPIQSEGSMLNDRLARESTNFTSQNEAILSGYLQKLQNGVALSQTEMTTAEQLAAAKLQYDQVIESAKIQATATQNAAKIGNQYQTLTPAQTLLNTFTGSTYKP